MSYLHLGWHSGLPGQIQVGLHIGGSVDSLYTGPLCGPVVGFARPNRVGLEQLGSFFCLVHFCFSSTSEMVPIAKRRWCHYYIFV